MIPCRQIGQIPWFASSPGGVTAFGAPRSRSHRLRGSLQGRSDWRSVPDPGFLEALISDAPRKIILIVDNLKVHKAALVKEWLRDKNDRIELAFLPPYAPESNPDEYLNSDFKTNLRLGPVSENREQMIEKAMSFMTRLSSWPERVRAYFQHPSAKYAA